MTLSREYCLLTPAAYLLATRYSLFRIRYSHLIILNNLSQLLTSSPNSQNKFRKKLSPPPSTARNILPSRHTRRAKVRAGIFGWGECAGPPAPSAEPGGKLALGSRSEQDCGLRSSVVYRIAVQLAKQMRARIEVPTVRNGPHPLFSRAAGARRASRKAQPKTPSCANARTGPRSRRKIRVSTSQSFHVPRSPRPKVSTSHV